MKLSLITLVSLVILLLFSTVALANIEANVTVINNDVKIGQEAHYTLKVVNSGHAEERVSIYSLHNGLGWLIEPVPLRDKVVTISAGSAYSASIVVKSHDTVAPGIYHLPLTVETQRGEREEVYLKVYLSPINQVDYEATIKPTIDMNEKINPKEPVSVKIALENKNLLNLSNLTVRIESDIPEFAKQAMIDLGPRDNKTVEFTITPDPYQQPKQYVLSFVFERNMQPIKVVEKVVEIIALVPPFTIEPVHEKSFLKRVSTLTITNQGNVLNTQDVTYPISYWDVLVVTNSDAQVVRTDEGRFLLWSKTLAPHEATQVMYVTNYRLYIYFLLVIIGLVLFYFYVKAPIILQKSAVTTRNDADGSLSEIKVTLEFRNVSKKHLKNVIIEDFIPAIAQVEKSLQLGTLKPQHIKPVRGGTIITWVLPDMDAGDHRVVSYKLKAKLNILGIFELPRASAEYEISKLHKGKAYSNIFRINV